MCYYLFPCSPLSPSEGLDKEVLFDLELTGLLNTENSSPSPAAASEWIKSFIHWDVCVCVCVCR